MTSKDEMDPSSNIKTWKWVDKCPLAGYSVIVASVSVGNVGQLAGDLLVTSLGMRRVATLYSAALVPVCGADPYRLASDDLCTAADFYASSATRTAVLQIRAPLVARRTAAFLEEIVESLKSEGVDEIVVLSSSFAHEKHVVLSSSFRYCTNDLFKRNINTSWLKHDRVGDKIVIHGGGFASLLLEICSERSMPAMILFKYCSEGDNTPDARETVAVLAQVLPLFPEVPSSELDAKLTQPISWRLLFGGPPPRDIY